MNTSEEAERREKEKERYCPFTAVRSKKEAYENVCHCTIHSDTPAMPPVSSIWFSYNIANSSKPLYVCVSNIDVVTVSDRSLCCLT